MYGAAHGYLQFPSQVEGEILGLVGESGSGKSTFGKALMRLRNGSARITNGELWFDGQNLMELSNRQMRDLRGSRLAMVFQDPMTSLNPVQKIVDHLTETMLTHRADWDEDIARDRAENLVERLGIRRERIDDYPHQMSGGMRQRVMIALALALNCDLVIADEPTPAPEPGLPPASSPLAPDESGMVVLDVRGLEPPEPMMRTLTALERLPEGSTLLQINVRTPQFLLPILEERGFRYEIREQEPGLVRLFIRRTAGPPASTQETDR